jgi:hypothetical protein
MAGACELMTSAPSVMTSLICMTTPPKFVTVKRQAACQAGAKKKSCWMKGFLTVKASKNSESRDEMVQE